jgi:hypothetical protein
LLVAVVAVVAVDLATAFHVLSQMVWGVLVAVVVVVVAVK